MVESKIKEVAKLLDVEMDEPIIIKGCHYNPYHLEERGLVDCDGDIDNYALSELLVGKLEIEKQILTDKEKQYLEGVLRPFKDRVNYVAKVSENIYSFIQIEIKPIDCGVESIELPYFKPNVMYKNMELNKEYTLEELGLFDE